MTQILAECVYIEVPHQVVRWNTTFEYAANSRRSLSVVLSFSSGLLFLGYEELSTFRQNNNISLFLTMWLLYMCDGSR